MSQYHAPCTGLRALSMLRLRPLRGGEMGDSALMDSGLTYLTGLQDLEFRGCLDNLSDDVRVSGVQGSRTRQGSRGKCAETQLRAHWVYAGTSKDFKHSSVTSKLLFISHLHLLFHVAGEHMQQHILCFAPGAVQGLKVLHSLTQMTQLAILPVGVYNVTVVHQL